MNSSLITRIDILLALSKEERYKYHDHMVQDSLSDNDKRFSSVGSRTMCESDVKNSTWLRIMNVDVSELVRKLNVKKSNYLYDQISRAC